MTIPRIQIELESGKIVTIANDNKGCMEVEKTSDLLEWLRILRTSHFEIKEKAHCLLSDGDQASWISIKDNVRTRFWKEKVIDITSIVGVIHNDEFQMIWDCGYIHKGAL